MCVTACIMCVHTFMRGFCMCASVGTSFLQCFSFPGYQPLVFSDLSFCTDLAPLEFNILTPALQSSSICES